MQGQLVCRCGEWTFEPEIKDLDAMMSSPCWEVIIISTVIVLTVSATGVEVVCEKHLWIVDITENN